MSKQRPKYFSRKEDFVNGMAVRRRTQDMDFVDSLGLFRSKTGEYYVEHREHRIFKDERGLRGKSECSNLGLEYISETDAANFLKMCFDFWLDITPFFWVARKKGIEFVPYAERY